MFLFCIISNLSSQAPVEEEIQWCPPAAHEESPLSLNEMLGWIALGPVCYRLCLEKNNY